MGMRNDLTVLISECYSIEGSTCELHSVFQPQVFLNLLFPYLHSLGIQLPEDPATLYGGSIVEDIKE